MRFVLRYMLIARYGWRWAIVRVSDRVVIKHRKLHIKAVGDLRAMSSEPMEYIYEGRTKSKLSVLSAIRRIETTAIPTPVPGVIENLLYPQRSGK